jgi:stress-induced morphogen
MHYLAKHMAMEKEVIEKFIKESILDANVIIEDLRGDGDHYSATVISKSFLGKTKVEQHKMVYESLQGKVGKELHALMLKTKSE